MPQAANDNRKPGPRIGNVTAGFMIATAFLFDAAQFLATLLHVIPVIGNAASVVLVIFITTFATATFWIWFMLHGVNYISGRGAVQRSLIALTTVVTELIPLINALPAMTVAVTAIIVQTRIQDNLEKPVAANDNQPAQETRKAA